MGDPKSAEGGTFATLLRETRRGRGMTQDQLIEASGVSRATLLRWEQTTPDKVDPDQVRRLCLALGLDTREAVIALGFVTREEMGLPAAPPPIDAGLLDAARLLADEKIPEATRASLRQHLQGAVNFWYEQLGVRRPVREPSGRELTRRTDAKH